MRDPAALWARYKLRLRRKRLLWRGFRSRHALSAVRNRTGQIAAEDILLFACMRNEAMRLPYFLKFYRALGVSHFLIVDNDSTDGTGDLLAGEGDVSLWHTTESYKASRFGMDWVTWLQWRYGAGHWALTVDADELLIYPDHDTRPLQDLTRWMTARGQAMLGATMLDLYPKGLPDAQSYVPGQDPCEVLRWFDAWGYWAQLQPKMSNLWLQGGVRARCFFEGQEQLAPTLNKIPLVRWDRSCVYVNSTHSALPPRLNRIYDVDGQEKLTGVLLHTKFLPGAADHAREEQVRGEHFSNSAQYDSYYDAVAEGRDMWCAGSVEYAGWRQLVDLGLMWRGDW